MRIGLPFKFALLLFEATVVLLSSQGVWMLGTGQLWVLGIGGCQAPTMATGVRDSTGGESSRRVAFDLPGEVLVAAAQENRGLMEPLKLKRAE